MVVSGSKAAPRIVGCCHVSDLDPVENPLIAKNNRNTLSMSIKDAPLAGASMLPPGGLCVLREVTHQAVWQRRRPAR